MNIRSVFFRGLLTFIVLGTLSNYGFSQERRQVIIESADRMRNLKRDGMEIRRLLGNVIMRHDNVVMHSDSTYDYTTQNRFEAFGNIKVNQQTSTLFGDTLYYDSHSKKGKVRGKLVKLVDEGLELVTHYLDFDSHLETANFFEGGIITTDSTRFSSERGIYRAKEKIFSFGGQVAYKDSTLLLNTDSLVYDTNAEIIYFFGPTRIYSDESYAFAHQGWYSRRDSSFLLQNDAYIDNGDQKIFGEKIFHNQKEDFSQITTLGCVIDTVEQLTLYANYIEYSDESGVGLAHDDPLLCNVSQEGDTLFLSADLFSSVELQDTVPEQPEPYHLLKGIGNAKFYRPNLQGICDSMYFHSVDSLLTMYSNPLVWNDVNQLTGNTIEVLFKDEVVHRMFFYGNAFVASQEDSIHFNQISGREMVGFFSEGQLSKLNVNGNAQTIYYGRDEGVLSAVNRAESTNLTIYIVENQISDIMFREEPNAVLYPINDVQIKEVTLKNFAWHSHKRPQNSEAIIPTWIDFEHFERSEQRAQESRGKKMNPATSLKARFKAEKPVNKVSISIRPR